MIFLGVNTLAWKCSFALLFLLLVFPAIVFFSPRAVVFRMRR